MTAYGVVDPCFCLLLDSVRRVVMASISLHSLYVDRCVAGNEFLYTSKSKSISGATLNERNG
jgi:hypothetical protein